ncbi:hypothetical protein RUND412_011058 [Rhizina undulata]
MSSQFYTYDHIHSGAPLYSTHGNHAQPGPPPELASSPVMEKPRGRPRRSTKNNNSTIGMENSGVSLQGGSSGMSGVGDIEGRSVAIRTKFPVARIKRIMQADEDVGKVAQVTPVVVSKALELFMIALCDKASAQARVRNSKRITAGHLKQAVLHEEQFDFLADIISKVPDIPLPSENSTHSNHGESEDGSVPVKKTRKPRQKRVKDDEGI